jgi:outer membrane protein W
MYKILTLILATTLALASQEAFAQRFSLMAYGSSFDLDSVSDASSAIDYTGSLSLGLNARAFIKKKWAVRLGVGLDQLSYAVSSDSFNTNYEARRRDIKGIVGLERHFTLLSNRLDIYPGIYVPLTFVGEEEITAGNLQNLSGDDIRAGLGALVGVNLRLFERVLLGVEFDANYDDFDEAVRSTSGDLSQLSVSGISYTTTFTLGIGLGY